MKTSVYVKAPIMVNMSVRLKQKVADVKRQLQCGEAVLVWSELHETVNIMPRSQFRE